jgi:hypothetical protein
LLKELVFSILLVGILCSSVEPQSEEVAEVGFEAFPVMLEEALECGFVVVFSG